MKKTILILAVTAFASFLATFNETFLNVAFTPIMKDFSVPVHQVQWLTTAYMLGAAIMVPISSFMYKKFKTKKLFLFTVFLLMIGSLICALAPSFKILLIGRIIQSLGTGMLIPIGMNITLNEVPKDKLGSSMGIMGAMTTLGPSLSIIVSGTILKFSSWHMLFIVFGIMTFLLFLMALIILKNNEKNEDASLDALSVIFISLALIFIMYGTSILFSKNVFVSLVCLILGFAFLILFIKRQNKIEKPLISLKPLLKKEFKIGIVLNMLALMLVFSMNIVLPLHIQNALGVSAFTSSLTLFPAIIISCLISPIAGRLYDKGLVYKILPFGFILMSIFILILGINSKMQPLLLVTLLYVPVICGSALIIGPAQSFALSSLDKNINSHGVTMMSMGFQIAGCIGCSLFTGIYSLNSNLYKSFFVVSLFALLVGIVGFIISLSIRKIKNNKEKNITLENIMKKDVYYVMENDSILNVLQEIVKHKVSGVPVLNNEGNIVGFISDGDIMKYLSTSHPLFTNVYSLMVFLSDENKFDNKLNSLMNSKVKDIMKKKVVTIDIHTSLEDVCKILENKHMKKAPVLENGKMVGVINRSNITKYAINTYLHQL